MQEKRLKNDVRAYGPTPVVAYARWAPSSSATQTLTEAFGVNSITRSGAGTYAVNLSEAHKAVVPVVQVVDNGTTHYHFVRAESTTTSVINVKLRSCAFADVVTGPTATDTADEIVLLVMARHTD